MRKSLIVAIAIVSTIPCTAIANPFNGPYIGVQGGYDMYHVNGNAALGGFTGNVDFGASGGNGGLFGGYGKTIGNIYLGAEIEGSLSNADMKLSDNAGDNVGIKSKSTFGAAARLGYLTNPSTLLYASAGAVRSKYDGEGSLVGSTNLTGGRFGLGAETILASNITGRLGWSYTNYQSHTIGGTTVTLSPKESLFRVGLAYNF